MFWLNKNNKSNRFRRYIMYAMGFVLSISVALPAYLQSSFLNQYITLEAVSLFFVFSNIVTAILIGCFPYLIKELGNYFTAKTVMITYVASLLGLVATNNAITAIFSLLLFCIASNLLWINIDILLEEASSNKKTGQIRTLYLTFNNLGWILSPIFSAYLIKTGEFTLAFLIAAILVIPLFIIFTTKRRSLKIKKSYRKEDLRKSFTKLWKNKNLKGVFVAAIALNIFFSGGVLYIPVYLNQTLGMSWNELGWIFSFMLLPFIIFQIPAGYLADKYFGEKEIMLIGLFTIFISLLLFFCIKVPNAWIWASALFLSRIGAALVEAMRDTYFFKNVGAKEIGYINLFRMTGPIGYVIGTATASILLLFLPINYLFIVFAAMLIPSFYYIALIKDTK